MGSGMEVAAKSCVWRLNILTLNLGWTQKYAPMLGGNSLDAEISGCSMLIESLKKCVDKFVRVR